MDTVMPPLKGLKRLSDINSVSNNSNINNNYTMPVPANVTVDNEQYYTCRHYPPKVLNNLSALRRNSRFCDVEIIAGGKVIKAHRAVLAASSPYFHAMFTGGLCEQRQQAVELHDVCPAALSVLIDFVYSGEVRIHQHNVQDLIVAADMLELQEVVRGCTDFLTAELHASNAVGIYRFAEGHNCAALAQAAAEYIEKNFPQVCEEDELYELPKEQLARFLTSERLHVDSECQVFRAALKWIQHDVNARRRYVFEVLRLVRIPLLSSRLLERAASECIDASLRVALRSVRRDLATRRGSLVPLFVHPRLCAKKDIFVIGGSKREVTTGWSRCAEATFESVERFDTFRREWCRATAMAVGRILPGVAVLDGKVYVVGGEQESKILASGERYDPDEDKWTAVASMVTPRCEFGLCAVGGSLWALGGWVGEDIGGSIERYDPVADRWRIAGEMQAPRFSMGVVAYDGLIYVVGGCSHTRRHLQDLMSYDPATGEWSELPPMGVARSQMGCAILDDHLYVVGGMNRHYEVLGSAERYSFRSRRWTPLPPMQIARGSPAVAAVDGLLYVIGGDQTHDINFYRAQITITSVECFDPLTNVWCECPPLPESRSEAGAIVL